MPVVDLFCGCGGLSKGFEQAGFDIAAAFDGWSSAITCYNANFDHEAIQCDLSDVKKAVEAITPFEPTVIIGGPPCQEFSHAGRREEGARADLTFKYAEIITTILPDYFVMENVPRVQNSNAYSKAKRLYIDNHYGLTEIVLNASYCGAPQKRKRFFCIGALNAPNNFLLDRLFDACSDNEITIRNYFREKNIPLDIDCFYRHPTTYSRRAIFSVDDASPTIRGVNRPKPDTYRRHENDAVDEAGLADVRCLTLAERAAIQTFPADYQFDGLNISRGDLEQMVGNAVPVVLAQFVAERLHEYMMEDNHPTDDKNEFSAWLRNEKKYASDRSISDVFSRIHRAQKMLPDRDIDKYYMVDLGEVEEYKALPVSVRSQIKKAINLRLAFEEWKNNQ